MKPSIFVGGVAVMALVVLFAWQGATELPATSVSEAPLSDEAGANTNGGPLAIDTPQPSKLLTVLGIVDRLGAHPTELPEADTLAALRPEHEEALLALYDSTPDLSARFACTRALGYAGGTRALHRFSRALFEEWSGCKVSAREESTLLHTVFAVGLLAQSNDEAFEVLRTWVVDDVWRLGVSWQSDRGASANRMFAGFAFQALGVSGRQEARVLLQSIVDRIDAGQPVSAADSRGDIAEAFFFLEYVEEHGVDGLRAMLAPEDRSEVFSKYLQTESGSKWFEWATGRKPVPGGKVAL